MELQGNESLQFTVKCLNHQFESLDHDSAEDARRNEMSPRSHGQFYRKWKKWEAGETNA